MLTDRRVQRLLDKVCVELGFCLSPTDQLQLRRKPPETVAEFTDAIFVAEGMDQTIADRNLYRLVKGYVTAAFAEAE